MYFFYTINIWRLGMRTCPRCDAAATSQEQSGHSFRSYVLNNHVFRSFDLTFLHVNWFKMAQVFSCKSKDKQHMKLNS